MSRRSFFEVASVLLGIFFIVSAFGSLPMIVAYPWLGEEGGLRKFLVWLGPFLYVLAGLCLISRSVALAWWLFPNEEQDAKPSKPIVRLSQYFAVGARLLGLYSFIRFLPQAVTLLVDLKERGRDGLEIRSALATILVLGVSLTILLKSDWLAGMLYGDDARDDSGSTPHSEIPEAPVSADEPRS